MRIAAFLAFIICAGLAYLTWIGVQDDYENKGDPTSYPIWTGYPNFVVMVIFAILFLIYALGFWDAFVEWGQFKRPEFPVGSQF